MAKERPTTKLCKYCKTEIPYDAKVCPNCRKKVKGIGCLPVILIIVGIMLIVGGLGGGKSDTNTSSKPTNSKPIESSTSEKNPSKEPAAPIEYTKVKLSTMMSDLKSNALKAQSTYKDNNIEITGKLSVVDSSGKYISLVDANDAYAIIGVQCYMKTDEQKSQVANMTIGDTVTLRGKCTNVGEVLGYSLNIDSIDGFKEEKTVSTKLDADGYIEVTAAELKDVLDKNPLNASNTYKGKKISVKGVLSNIDSNGKYIDINTGKSLDFTSIQCYIKTDEQKKIVMDLTVGDKIVVKGTCKDVGELLGYSINIESIIK